MAECGLQLKAGHSTQKSTFGFVLGHAKIILFSFQSSLRSTSCSTLRPLHIVAKHAKIIREVGNRDMLLLRSDNLSLYHPKPVIVSCSNQSSRSRHYYKEIRSVPTCNFCHQYFHLFFSIELTSVPLPLSPSIPNNTNNHLIDIKYKHDILIKFQSTYG